MKRFMYTTYCGVAFFLLGMTVLIVNLFIPGLRHRRLVAGSISRAFLRMAGIPFKVEGIERLPSAPCVVVANHASYIDAVVAVAALPPDFAFVIKKEMVRVPLAGLLLRRVSSEFVERFNRQKGASDVRRVLRTAASGHSLVFFPEGTFTNEVGLGKFHTGAFAIAARAACPVVPAVILGTRRNMPATRILPRPGAIEVRYGAPIAPLVQASGDPALLL